MNYINKIISRIEAGRHAVINFDIDSLTRRGTKFIPIGLLRDAGKWFVQIETVDVACSLEVITLQQYMEKTKDMK